jgi:hypothetical protein
MAITPFFPMLATLVVALTWILTVVCQDLLFKKWGMGVAGMPMGN